MEYKHMYSFLGVWNTFLDIVNKMERCFDRNPREQCTIDLLYSPMRVILFFSDGQSTNWARSIYSSLRAHGE